VAQKDSSRLLLNSRSVIVSGFLISSDDQELAPLGVLSDRDAHLNRQLLGAARSTCREDFHQLVHRARSPLAKTTIAGVTPSRTAAEVPPMAGHRPAAARFNFRLAFHSHYSVRLAFSLSASRISTVETDEPRSLTHNVERFRDAGLEMSSAAHHRLVDRWAIPRRRPT